VWGLPAVAREVGAWRTRALTIPDAPIRADALASLAHKRGNIDGAALFWTLPRVRNLTLIGLLASYEMICDFLDSMNEPPTAANPVNGRQLHLSLIEALDFDRPTVDHYRHHPCHDDGGYLKALIQTSRARSAALPAYESVREQVVHEATRFEIIAINHDIIPTRRETAHRTWAAQEFPTASEASWFELTAAATASLTIHALLALSAEPTDNNTSIGRAQRAYFPWITLATTMLDHLVDQAEDQTNGDHSYLNYYPTPESATLRINELVHRCLREARTLDRSGRHTLIAACMVAMYLSKDSARTPSMRATTKSLTDAGGSLTRLLVPILRLWRIAYAQRST
jgi:tetraprenyl-beta-curcumene synthase